MSLKAHIARILLSTLLMSLFIIFYVKPKASISTADYVVVVLTIEIIAVVVAYTISSNSVFRTFFQILALSFLFAAVILLALSPTNGTFEQLFLGVMVIQIIGLSVGTIGTRASNGPALA